MASRDHASSRARPLDLAVDTAKAKWFDQVKVVTALATQVLAILPVFWGISGSHQHNVHRHDQSASPRISASL
jgi:hypothetical protein